jgi:hypothetical protein
MTSVAEGVLIIVWSLVEVLTEQPEVSVKTMQILKIKLKMQHLDCRLPTGGMG